VKHIIKYKNLNQNRLNLICIKNNNQNWFETSMWKNKTYTLVNKLKNKFISMQNKIYCIWNVLKLPQN